MSKVRESTVEKINALLQKAKCDYDEVPSGQRSAQLQRLIESYHRAMQLYNDDLSFSERAQVQEEISHVQEMISPLSNSPTGLLAHLKSPSPLARFRALPLIAKAGLVLLVLLVISGAVVLTGSSIRASLAAASCMPGSLHIDGSTALEPLVSSVAQDYMHACPGASIHVEYPGHASITGLESVENGSIDIGDSDIFAFPAQRDLVDHDHQVAVVIFALIVNRQVGKSIHKLTTDQLKKIFTGVYTNWRQLGGPNLSIIPLSRTVHSGTRYTFEKYVLQGVQTIIGTEAPVSSTPEAVQEVASMPGAISYTTLDEASQSVGVSVVSIDGYEPTVDLVKSNTYRFWNIEHMYTKGQPTAVEQAFLNYVDNDAPKQIQQHFKGFLDIYDVTPQMSNARSIDVS
ncbi:MAG: substrate-binding domain-containing protein [Ktedonobacteraceae bacterium]|nr:substrate-binding domain-containing protein [Ktedonobacteraceae bacterium]